MTICLVGNKICKSTGLNPCFLKWKHPWKLGKTPVEYLRNIKIEVFMYAPSLFFLMEAVYMSENRFPSVVACSFRCLRSVEHGSPLASQPHAGVLAGAQLPQRPRCRHPPAG